MCALPDCRATTMADHSASPDSELITPSPQDSLPKETMHTAQVEEAMAHEQSPLLPAIRVSTEANGAKSDASEDSDDGHGDTWLADEHESKSTWYMFLLTLGGFGYVE